MNCRWGIEDFVEQDICPVCKRPIYEHDEEDCEACAYALGYDKNLEGSR